jgi:hypothetical protein
VKGNEEMKKKMKNEPPFPPPQVVSKAKKSLLNKEISFEFVLYFLKHKRHSPLFQKRGKIE